MAISMMRKTMVKIIMMMI